MNKNKSAFSLLFLLNPLIAAVLAIKNYDNAKSKNIFWAFSVFYGLTFAIGAESDGSDIVRYVAELKWLHVQSFSFTGIINYYLESGEIDFFRSIIVYTVSIFTDSGSILTGISGFVFGYFFSRNIWFILSRLKGKINTATKFLIICVILIAPIWFINGFRMWTAMHIFIFGLLPLLYDGNKKYIWLSFASIFVHFAFLFPSIVLIVYLIAGNRIKLYFFIFCLSLMFTQFEISKFNELFEQFLPKAITERTASYRSEEKVSNFREQSNQEEIVWYAKWYRKALYWALFVLLIRLYFKSRNLIKKNSQLVSYFSFVLLFFSFANFSSSMPSGTRFQIVASFIALSFIILYLQNINEDILFKKFVKIVYPFLLLFLIISVRTGFYSTSVQTIIGNPIVLLFKQEFISLNDILKWVF